VPKVLQFHPAAQAGDGPGSGKCQPHGLAGRDGHRIGNRFFAVAPACRIAAQLAGQKIIDSFQGGAIPGGEIARKRGHLGAFGKGAVGKVIVASPAFVGHDLARLLIGNGHIAVGAARAELGQVVGQHGQIERRLFAAEIVDKRQVHGRLLLAVQVNLYMALLGQGRPDAPNAARPFHLGQYILVAFFANELRAVIVGCPVDILAALRVVATGPIEAGPLGAALAGLGQDGQMLQVDQALCQISVCQLFLAPARGAQADTPDASGHDGQNDRTNDGWQFHRGAPCIVSRKKRLCAFGLPPDRRLTKGGSPWDAWPTNFAHISRRTHATAP